MRDAAGEAPDRLHLLGLAELVLHLVPLGHVLRDGEHARYAAEAERVRGDLDVDEASVLPPVPLQSGGRAGVLRKTNVVEAHREELVARVPVAADRGVVDREKRSDSRS